MTDLGLTEEPQKGKAVKPSLFCGEYVIAIKLMQIIRDTVS